MQFLKRHRNYCKSLHLVGAARCRSPVQCLCDCGWNTGNGLARKVGVCNLAVHGVLT